MTHTLFTLRLYVREMSNGSTLSTVPSHSSYVNLSKFLSLLLRIVSPNRFEHWLLQSWPKLRVDRERVQTRGLVLQTTKNRFFSFSCSRHSAVFAFDWDYTSKKWTDWHRDLTVSLHSGKVGFTVPLLPSFPHSFPFSPFPFILLVRRETQSKGEEHLH